MMNKRELMLIIIQTDNAFYQLDMENKSLLKNEFYKSIIQNGIIDITVNKKEVSPIELNSIGNFNNILY